MFKKAATVSLLLLSLNAFAQTNLTDTQIGKVALTINEGEIDAAHIAKNKAQKKEVKDFASMMMDEHKKNIKETKNIARQEKMKPEKSDYSESLKEEAKKSNKELKSVDKAAIDKAYIDQQVMMHEKALSTFDNFLIPQTKNAALKSHLEKTREAVAAHLAHAKEIQTRL